MAVWPKRKNFFKGITLIELLIVMAVLGFLILFSALAVPTQLKKARDAKRKSDLEKIKIALYDYHFDSNCFLKTLPACGERFGSEEMAYLAHFPCDPQKNPYGYQTEDKECSQWFKVLTNLENNQDSGIAKVGCQNGCGSECEYNYGLASSNIRVNEGCVAYYACTPSGNCEEFEDPSLSQCPRIFENNSTCNDVCGEKENRCHDERGKKVPEK